MVEVEDQGEGQDGEPSCEPPAKKQKCRKSQKGPRAKGTPLAAADSCAAAGAYAPNDYSKKRTEFIRNLKDEGVSHADANQRWNDSALKKELLSTLSVSELIRRRFCPAGTTKNPWA